MFALTLLLVLFHIITSLGAHRSMARKMFTRVFLADLLPSLSMLRHRLWCCRLQFLRLFSGRGLPSPISKRSLAPPDEEDWLMRTMRPLKPRTASPTDNVALVRQVACHCNGVTLCLFQLIVFHGDLDSFAQSRIQDINGRKHPVHGNSIFHGLWNMNRSGRHIQTPHPEISDEVGECWLHLDHAFKKLLSVRPSVRQRSYLIFSEFQCQWAHPHF